MGRTLSIALAQFPPIVGTDPVGQLRDQAAEILSASTDLDLLVFPEIHLCGDCDNVADSNEWLRSAAEPLDGLRMQGLARVAEQLGVWLIPGTVPELGDDGRVYNTQVVLDAGGNLVASYRKVFPWRPYEAWSSGHEFTVFDMAGRGRGGLSICCDAWFPESTRSVAWLGAEFVVNVVKTIGADRKQERVLAQANAIANQVFMLSVNAAGPIVMVAVIGGSIFIVVTYFVTLVSHGGTFSNADSLASDIAKTIGGSLFGAVFLTGLIVGQFTSGLSAQAAVARLLYAMGRDRVLPERLFGWVSARFRTPVFNIALCGVIGLAAIFLDVTTSTSFINFGAFTAFTLVNVAVIAYYLRHRDERLNLWRYILLPVVGALIDIYLLTQLDSKALILGMCWLGLGIVYLLVLTRGLTKPPPQMTSIAEAD